MDTTTEDARIVADMVVGVLRIVGMPDDHAQHVAPAYATVCVDGYHYTGRIYHVRDNGWPCIETASGHVASGPEVTA